jgi:hypothetical protein
MSRVISIDYGINPYGKKMYGIVFNSGSIERFLITQDDYSLQEFMSIVLSEHRNSLDAEIVFDSNGMGKAIEDYLLSKGISGINPLSMGYMSELPSRFVDAKNSLLDLAINSSFDSTSNIEFKKLVKEFDNFELNNLGDGKIKLNKKDKEMGSTRAMCYLAYFTKYAI